MSKCLPFSPYRGDDRPARTRVPALADLVYPSAALLVHYIQHHELTRLLSSAILIREALTCQPTGAATGCDLSARRRRVRGRRVALIATL